MFLAAYLHSQNNSKSGNIPPPINTSLLCCSQLALNCRSFYIVRIFAAIDLQIDELRIGVLTAEDSILLGIS